MSPGLLRLQLHARLIQQQRTSINLTTSCCTIQLVTPSLASANLAAPPDPVSDARSPSPHVRCHYTSPHLSLRVRTPDSRAYPALGKRERHLLITTHLLPPRITATARDCACSLLGAVHIIMGPHAYMCTGAV